MASEHIKSNVQIIKQDGHPAFVVLPYSDWVQLTGLDDADCLPHEVVSFMVRDDLSLIAAWRKYRGLTQDELAQRIGTSQPAVAAIEKKGSRPQQRTLVKLAAALDATVGQLED